MTACRPLATIFGPSGLGGSVHPPISGNVCRSPRIGNDALIARAKVISSPKAVKELDASSNFDSRRQRNRQGEPSFAAFVPIGLEDLWRSVDGVEAVEKARALRPDVILMDVSMPRMDGLQATRIIRKESPESKVILVSQNDPAITRRQTTEVDAAAFVPKSELGANLIPTLDRVLGHSRTEGATKLCRQSIPGRNGSQALENSGTLFATTTGQRLRSVPLRLGRRA